MATDRQAARPGPGPARPGAPGNRPAAEHFDVVIVGGRCAGSPLATLLARAGLKVAVVEQATFPRPVLSSHLMEADGLLFLKRLGALDAVAKTGVRFLKQVDLRLNELRLEARFPQRFDDVGGAAFLHRHLLDEILADVAAEAGAHLRMGTKAVELLWERQRVRGVRVQDGNGEYRLTAPLVVGADGRNSTVAYMCGARKYSVRPNERSYYFTFFEGADPAYDDHFVFHRWGDRMVWAGPADNGLYLLGVSPEQHERDYFRAETEAGLMSHVRACDTTAKALAGARIAEKISGIRNFDGYFRQATGPGWVLAGDAGHFKDPALGRGIGDAFMQAETLASAIVSGLGRSGADPAEPDLDLSLRRWAEWRDRRFEGHYWLATNLGRAGVFPTMIPEAVRRLDERGELDRFFDLFSHRARYDDVFPLGKIGAATGRMLRSPRTKPLPLLREAVTLLAREPVRRLTGRFPIPTAPELTAAPPLRAWQAVPDQTEPEQTEPELTETGQAQALEPNGA